jgi:hypothetical protein
MFEFIPAKELKKKYKVYGHFYSVSVINCGEIKGRSVLEIISNDENPESADLLSDKVPDAVFILMNPGSSEPADAKAEIDLVDNMGEMEVKLVESNPDDAQFQIMRVMHYCGYNHVRVLSLSDIRHPNSNKFYGFYHNIVEKGNFHEHSIFYKTRYKELIKKIGLKPLYPIICGWGLDKNLDPLIKKCIKMLPHSASLYGLKVEGEDNKYFHPLPRTKSEMMAWVEMLVQQIKS